MKEHQTPDGLTRLLASVGTSQHLTHDEEQDLVRRWQEHQDPAALDRLVRSHLRLVAKIARRYRGYGLPLADLVSEGTLGLLQAVRKFDPEKGFRLSTYATWWVRACVQGHVLGNWSLVRMGSGHSQKKLFFGLRRLKAHLDAYESGDLPPQVVAAIAADLAVGKTEVVDMNRRLTGADSSLNAPVGETGEAEVQDLLVDERPSPEAVLAEAQEKVQRLGWLRSGLEVLDDRERQILIARHLRDEPETLEKLGRRFAVSHVRIRQIEAAALAKLQRAVKRAVSDTNLRIAA